MFDSIDLTLVALVVFLAIQAFILGMLVALALVECGVLP